MENGRRWILGAALLALLGCGSTKGADAGAGGSAAAGGSGSGGAGFGGGASATGGAGSGNQAGASGGAGGAKGAGGAPPEPAGSPGSAGLSSAGGVTSSGGTGIGAGASQTGGAQSVGGAPSAGAGGAPTVPSALVISSNATWTTTQTWTETTSELVDVTVDDSVALQTWEGFGGAIHEMGWDLLSTQALEDEAVGLLFGADGARLNLARIPIGGSDYSLERYTLADTAPDVVPDEAESNRPESDLTLSAFSIERDKRTLIPHVKAALAVNPNIRVWAAPWTPPVWMKTGYKQSNAGTGAALRPSYFDGGTMRDDPFVLSVYAEYLVKFIAAYRDEGISIDTIAPQSEPTFEHNYPSCLWANATYTAFIGTHLGPALLAADLDTKIMLGMMANHPKDSDLISAAMNDPAAKSFVDTIGIQWGVLAAALKNPLTYDVPVWVSEHKCGNYPFINSPQSDPPIAAYVEPAPNDYVYGAETWWYIRDAVKLAGATAYNFPHLVLDAAGKGNDTSREWAQNSLLVVDGGKITKTQAYYVVRHFSQFVEPGAKVVATTGGDAVAFENPDGALVAVVYSKAEKSDFTIEIGGKRLQFALPAGGWATVKYTP